MTPNRALESGRTTMRGRAPLNELAMMSSFSSSERAGSAAPQLARVCVRARASVRVAGKGFPHHRFIVKIDKTIGRQATTREALGKLNLSN